MAAQPNVERVTNDILSIIAAKNVQSGQITPWGDIQKQLVENGYDEVDIIAAFEHMGEAKLLEGSSAAGYVTLTQIGFQRLEALYS